jgi:hypothetical protein
MAVIPNRRQTPCAKAGRVLMPDYGPNERPTGEVRNVCIHPVGDDRPRARAATDRPGQRLVPADPDHRLLMEVDSWTGFTRHFTSLKSGHPSKDKQLLLTAILADGVNLGLVHVRLVAVGTNCTHEAPREVDDGDHAHRRENPRAVHAERGAASTHARSARIDCVAHALAPFISQKRYVHGDLRRGSHSHPFPGAHREVVEEGFPMVRISRNTCTA